MASWWGSLCPKVNGKGFMAPGREAGSFALSVTNAEKELLLETDPDLLADAALRQSSDAARPIRHRQPRTGRTVYPARVVGPAQEAAARGGGDSGAAVSVQSRTIGCVVVASVVPLALLALVLLTGFTTTWALTDQYVRSPDGSVIRVYAQPEWDYRNGWMDDIFMRDTTSFYIVYSPEVADRYDVTFVNTGRIHRVPFSCHEFGCGGHVEGPFPVIGRDVALCFRSKRGSKLRCAPLRFVYSKSTLPTLLDRLLKVT